MQHFNPVFCSGLPFKQKKTQRALPVDRPLQPLHRAPERYCVWHHLLHYSELRGTLKEISQQEKFLYSVMRILGAVLRLTTTVCNVQHVSCTDKHLSPVTLSSAEHFSIFYVLVLTAHNFTVSVHFHYSYQSSFLQQQQLFLSEIR